MEIVTPLPAPLPQFWLTGSLTWSFLWVFDYAIRLRHPLSSTSSRSTRYHIFTWPFAAVVVMMLWVSGDVRCGGVLPASCTICNSVCAPHSRSNDGTCSVRLGSVVNLVCALVRAARVSPPAHTPLCAAPLLCRWLSFPW